MSYRRSMNYSGSFNDMGRGYQRSQQMQMNPWNNSSEGMNQNSGNYQDNATLLLANNLISNLIRNSNNILPSLLDVNPMPMNQDYGSRRVRPGVPSKMLNRSNMSRQGNRDYGRNRVAKMSGTNNNMGNSRRMKQLKKNAGSVNNRSNKSQNAKRSTDTAKDGKKEKNEDETNAADTDKQNESSDEQNATKTDGENADSPKKNANNEFEGVDKRYFKCHVCKKSMWDGTSFKKHLKGRAHLMMMESLSDSYAIKGQLIRHEIRMAENTRQIETERKRRFGKGQGVNKQSMPVFCAMCDSEFTNTTLTLHRHSSGHLRLKRFLHPKCNSCEEEFPTRIDWDEHRLSTSHIKKISELGIIKLNTEEEEFKDFVEQGEDAGIDMQKYTTASTHELKDEDGEKADNAVKSEGTEEANSAFTDLVEGVDMKGCTFADLPKYDPQVPVGMSFMKEIPCYSCTICHHFLATSEAAAVHMKSLKHYDSFMKIMKKRIVLTQQKETKEAAESSIKSEAELNESKEQTMDEEMLEDKPAETDDKSFNETDASVDIDQTCNENEQMQELEENMDESMEDQKIETKIEKVDDLNNDAPQDDSSQKDNDKQVDKTATTQNINCLKQTENVVANKNATPNTRANIARGRASNRARRGTPRRY
uniref:Putative cathepsin b mrna 3'-untranslated-region-binding protein cbbp tabanus bromius n=1 Tax=Xenopsylla cheopis TaxID=163159 RepID=A0A6M2DNH7_XENCH